MSLLEMMIAVGMAGLLTAGGAVGLSRFADRTRVESATALVLTAYRRAQSVARSLGRPAELVVTADSIVVRSAGPAGPVVVWRSPGPARDGVGLLPAGHVAGFAPNGLGTGAANVTHVLTRGASRRQVVVSRLGRIRVTP